MNSLVATPPFPPHFHEHARLSPSRPMSSANSSGSRKRKADDDHAASDHDVRMSASPSNSPASLPAAAAAASTSRQVKRARPNVSGRPMSLNRMLETLDTDTLRSVLRSLCERHPELGTEILHTAPRPSVSSALEVLNNYQSTLQASFPLGGDPSSDYAYNRVRQHISNLLDALNDFTPHFLPPNESHVATSLNYLDGATEVVHGLPKWNTPQNNLEKDLAYEEIAKAWTLAIKEAGKRGGGIQLQYGGWDQKLVKHNQTAGGKLEEAVNAMSASLGWMTQDAPTSGPPGPDAPSIRQQLLSGTYGSGVPLKAGHW